MDGLRFLECQDANEWRNLFIGNVELYLDGAKAPDKKFKDFRNHVLHVADNYWGGAVVKTEEWYGRLVELLKDGDWKRAAYAAGVLTHYYTDPLMPLHTGQSEREGSVHRAIEWSVTKSYSELQNILVEDLGGYPTISPGPDADWLAAMVIAGAQAAHEHYDVLIDHYDLEVGSRIPTLGFDQECKDRLAGLIGHATIGVARILDRAISEAGMIPPQTNVSLNGVLSKLSTPLFWITRKLSDSKDRAAVKAIYAEVQETGRAIESLPDDEKEIRQLHAEEVLNVAIEDLADQPVTMPGSKHGEGTAARERSTRPIFNLPTDVIKEPKPKKVRKKKKKSEPADEGEADFFDGPRFYLAIDDPIVDAPSIGPKTASRLKKVGVRKVSDLLELNADDAAEQMASRHIDGDTIREWQAQSYLQCTIPGLRGHDAQILAGCGIENAQDLASIQAEELHDLASDFADTDEGQRIIRDGNPPDLAEVSNWIEWAGLGDNHRAAA
jgi:predicted flap endonuclease-1-like 5' DNA nuclease